MKTLKFIKAFILLIFCSIFLLSCCGGNPCRNTNNANVINQDAGVMVKGFSCDGYIQNLNDFPVRIKQVWQHPGETTQWIKEFKPGFRKSQYISHRHGFYVYNMEGQEIGFIKPQRSCKEEK